MVLEVEGPQGLPFEQDLLREMEDIALGLGPEPWLLGTVGLTVLDPRPLGVELLDPLEVVEAVDTGKLERRIPAQEPEGLGDLLEVVKGQGRLESAAW